MSKSKLKPYEFFDLALAERATVWEIFENRELCFFEWAWEFLKRNPHYIRAFENHINRNYDYNERFARFVQAREKGGIVTHIPVSHFEKEMDRLFALETIRLKSMTRISV